MNTYYSILSELNVSDGAADITTEPKMEAFHPHINAGMGFRQGAVGRQSRLETAVQFFAKDPASLDAHIALVKSEMQLNEDNIQRIMAKNRKLEIQLAELMRVKKKLLKPPSTLKRCSICNGQVTLKNFPRHLKKHQTRPAFQCDSCQMEFSRADNLRRHSRIHSDGRAFNCAVCEYNCARKDELTAHMHKSH